MSPLVLLSLLSLTLLIPAFEGLADDDVADADDPADPELPQDPDAPDTPEDPEEPPEAVTGTAGDDTLVGMAGQVVDGLAGADSLEASSGSVTLNGGEGQDTLFLEGPIIPEVENTSQANGGDGDDTITAIGLGGSVDGGGGDDVIEVQGTLDAVNGGNGDDTITASAADYGGGSPLNGGAGNDVLSTSDDAGFSYRAELDGGAGDDTLTSALITTSPEGFDALTGGAGADVFQVSFSGENTAPSGGALLGTLLEVTDFEPAEDSLVLEIRGFPVFAAQIDAGNQISFDVAEAEDGSGSLLNFTIANANANGPITGTILLSGVTGIAPDDVDFGVNVLDAVA
jgi:Ca2+-binding RTX toxin-like protein